MSTRWKHNASELAREIRTSKFGVASSYALHMAAALYMVHYMYKGIATAGDLCTEYCPLETFC